MSVAHQVRRILMQQAERDQARFLSCSKGTPYTVCNRGVLVESPASKQRPAFPLQKGRVGGR